MISTSPRRDVLTISDIHIGNRSTPGYFILQNLKRLFGDFSTKETNFPDLKLILIAGDFWDDTVPVSDRVITDVLVFWHLLAAWCSYKRIVLRLLEGTPRHDRQQNRLLVTYTQQNFPDLDFKYFDEIQVEIHQKLNLSLLYIPDECRPTADQAYIDACHEVHTVHGLDKVDIAVMHGMFLYQLGTIPMNHKVYREDQWLNLVKGFITIGHIHNQSFYERIYAQGSFDRLRHGEESPKGAYYFQEKAEGEWVPIFIENKYAKIYKTFIIKKPIADSLPKLERDLSILPKESHVRILAKAGHAILEALPQLRKQFPFIVFTKDFDDKDKTKKESNLLQHTQKDVVVLNKNTLNQAILDEIQIKTPITSEQQSRLNEWLNKLHA